jgi:hypothetical protein
MRTLITFAAILVAATLGGEAKADDLWGCQVLLCLSNPDGPEAVKECVPPIERLWDELRHGHPFPSCPSGGSAYARPTISYYDLCPAGTTELPTGQFGAAATAKREVYPGIGDGGAVAQWMYSATYGSQTAMDSKVCVGRRVGQGVVYLLTQERDQRGGQSYQAHAVGYYDRLVLLPPHGSPNVIDVYVDDTRYKRVRW